MGQVIGGIVAILILIWIVKAIAAVFVWALPWLKLGAAVLALLLFVRALWQRTNARWVLPGLGAALLALISAGLYWVDMDDRTFDIGGVSFPLARSEFKTAPYSCTKIAMNDKDCVRTLAGHFYGVPYGELTAQVRARRHAASLLKVGAQGEPTPSSEKRFEYFDRLDRALTSDKWVRQDEYEIVTEGAASWAANDIHFCGGQDGKKYLCPGQKTERVKRFERITYRRNDVPILVSLEFCNAPDRRIDSCPILDSETEQRVDEDFGKTGHIPSAMRLSQYFFSNSFDIHIYARPGT